jgi:hypothetical protein
MLGLTDNMIFQYNLSTEWDVSTATYENKNFSSGSQDDSSYGLSFNSDGTKMFIIGDTNDAVFQYNLSTEWDVSTATYENKNFSIASEDEDPMNVFFNSDGTKMYMIGWNNLVFQYNLSTEWDVSTATYENKNVSVESEDSYPAGLFLKSDTMYLLGTTTNYVYQYSLGEVWYIEDGVDYPRLWWEFGSESEAIIEYVEQISAVTLNGGTTKTVYAIFNVSNQNVIAETANISFSKLGEITRYASSCNNNTHANQFNCSIDMYFYDSAGLDWVINATINTTGDATISNDSISFTVNALDYVTQDVTLVNWANVYPNSLDNEADNTITLTNGGNQDYTVFTITGYDAMNGSNILPAENFSIDNHTGETSGQVYMVNNTAIDVTPTGLSLNNHGSSVSQEIFFYLDVPESLTQGGYTQLEQWKIKFA